MKNSVKIAIISSTATIIASCIAVFNYNVGNNDSESSIQNQQNENAVNVYVDNNIYTQVEDSELTNDPLSEDYITEAYDINDLETASFVEIKVRNNSKENPTWGDTVNINIGDQIEFQIEYKNTSEYVQNDVIVFDTLPENVKYIEGTSKRHDSNNPNGIKINPDDLFSGDGLNIGSFESGANSYINFAIEIIDVGLTDGSRTLSNEFRYSVGTESYIISKNYAYSRKGGWGPSRDTYTMEEPATYAVFNSIANNSAVGDERNFVRIAEKGIGDAYSDNIEIEANKQYRVYIYFHNNASSTYNDSEHDYVGIARDVRMSSYFPQSLLSGERGVVGGRISSTNTVPEAIWDSAYITAKEDVTLHYVVGSAHIYNQWEVNGAVLSMDLFSDKGTFIGLNKLNGTILGCDKYSGCVVYTILTKPVNHKEQ